MQFFPLYILDMLTWYLSLEVKGSMKWHRSTPTFCLPQGGQPLDVIKSASKGFADEAGGIEAGPLPNLMAGSNSLMRPRSQQFPAGGSTDSERCAPVARLLQTCAFNAASLLAVCYASRHLMRVCVLPASL